MPRHEKPTQAVTGISCRRNFGRTASIPREDAYLVGLQLRACQNNDIYFDGRKLRPTNFLAGMTSIYDLKRDPMWDVRDPFRCLMLYLPRRALDDAAKEAGSPGIGELRNQPGVATDDPVVRHLLTSLIPAMTRPQEAIASFVDHVFLALTVHVAQAYGGLHSIRGVRRGCLAPWQERRAKDLMSASLSERMPLSRLAAECGLSVRHFARAFRQSTGVPPHRWLLRYRVERAAELLGNGTLPLADIAIACGFADQSHFTRVFTALMGASPNVWRRTVGATEDLINGVAAR